MTSPSNISLCGSLRDWSHEALGTFHRDERDLRHPATADKMQESGDKVVTCSTMTAKTQFPVNITSTDLQ